MTVAEMIAAIDRATDKKSEARFVANVVAGQHRSPVRKLKGLLWLIEKGHEVRTGQFAIDELFVDGMRFRWKDLEHVRKVECCILASGHAGPHLYGLISYARLSGECVAFRGPQEHA